MRQAFDLAAEFNLGPEELNDLEQREIFIHDQRNVIIKAENQSLKQGLQQGQTEALRRLLQRRFNQLPPWVEAWLTGASQADLET